MEYIKERKKIADLFKAEDYLRDFDDLALQVFRFQYHFSPIYNRYCQALNVNLENIKSLVQIPFLPIQLFKTNIIKTGNWQAEASFKSSGTSGAVRSVHEIKSLEFYLENALKGFHEFYGDPAKISFLAILPGYEERQDSSLIHMVNALIHRSDFKNSGFYLNREELLIEELVKNKAQNVPTILFGVSFGLLELTRYKIDFPKLLVIETGGMKTSKIDMSKEEVIEAFKKAWNVARVDSEYGMTELLSQSYAIGDLWCRPASTKRLLINQLSDPFTIEREGKVGVVNVVDLANYDTCSFIETEDIGFSNSQGQFQVVGRLDKAELRGCNLLLEDHKA